METPWHILKTTVQWRTTKLLLQAILKKPTSKGPMLKKRTPKQLTLKRRKTQKLWSWMPLTRQLKRTSRWIMPTQTMLL